MILKMIPIHIQYTLKYVLIPDTRPNTAKKRTGRKVPANTGWSVWFTVVTMDFMKENVVWGHS
ncbi:hypothetical protein CHM34_12810 [Paludifilum halophilum]|uniref:Uncharacterized protein n=1 Tax=Paludifilum halophilum TaxID=1642702 RepID=A0A235B4L5_9BACL|nr:hypothetical protein CHM34_12810 [Paludifilum halophilum]